ncbi:MAG: HD domain-containing protein [Candidatus Midichloriaceae bacterium]
MIVAAILHDVVEDSECTVELIEKEFNARIAQIVDRLTNKRFENGK